MNIKTVLITGCAGFIGSNLVDYILSTTDWKVRGIDNFSTGRSEFLFQALQNSRFTLLKQDLKEKYLIIDEFEGVDCVFHLAANADVRNINEDTNVDLRENTLVTHNVLECMRSKNVKKIVFSSTGSVYGEAKVIPTPEDCPFPRQTSLYGASKLACEGLIAAYSELFGIQAWIFRFVSILGERYTHGHVYDFYKQLIKDPTSLRVLGDGNQKKSYLYIGDCVRAIMDAVEHFKDTVNVINLGTNEYCCVNDSILWIKEFLEVNPKIVFTGGNKGWVGDNPFIYLNTDLIRSSGWVPSLTIRDSIIKTLSYLQSNKWVLR